MLKINWFSPLPPTPSGIASNYSLQILPALAEKFDLSLWTDQESVSPEIERIARVVRFQPSNPPWRSLNNADLSIYHLGNHGGIHGGIWQVSRRHAGIVVLHDLSLHDFFNMVFLRVLERPDLYLEALERWYGDDGRHAGEAFRAGGITAEAMSQRFPLTREAARGALGVVTHSVRTLQELNEIPACPVAALDHPFAPSDERIYQQRLAIRRAAARPPYRLVIFGYLSRNRRLDAVLEALAGIPERARFSLNICGQVWDETHIRDEIDRLGLNGVVNLLGFLSDAGVEEQLSHADLAINLRFPSMGEASGSQLEFFNYGLPTLVTRTGWYAGLPEDATAFVRPEYEIEDLQNHLRAFLANPDSFRAIGERGRRSLQHNDPAAYAGSLVRFAVEALRFAPHVSALSLSGSIGKEMTKWLPPCISAQLIDKASREIFSMLEGGESKTGSSA